MQLSDFMIGPTLGTGSYGRVRQVKLKQKPREVYALKMLKKFEILKRNQLEHLKNEKDILSSVDNHFIIKLKGSFQDEHYVYMLLEYICGGELFGRLRKEGRFSNDVALFYITEIIVALSYLHDNNIAYRDLKPENILIDR
jgi:serine/threonine protein kinase